MEINQDQPAIGPVDVCSRCSSSAPELKPLNMHRSCCHSDFFVLNPKIFLEPAASLSMNWPTPSVGISAMCKEL